MRYPFVSPLIFSLWLLLSGLCISQTQAQNNLPAEKAKLLELNLRSGDQNWKAEQYYEAGQFYAKAIEISPEHRQAQYRLAECYRLTFDYHAAETTYAKVYQADAKNYPLAQYYQALMLKNNGKYAEAILHLDEFTTTWANASDRPEAISADWLAKAKQLKDRCQVAINEPKPDLSYFDRNKLSDLSAEYRLKADKIIRRKEAGRMHIEDMPLYGEDAYFYNLQLSQGQRTKVTKITANGLEKLTAAQMEVIRAANKQYYERLTADEQARMNRFAVAYRRAIAKNERVMVSEEDDMYYGLLSMAQKIELDGAIAYRMHLAIGSEMGRVKNKQNRLEETEEQAPAITSLESRPVVAPALTAAEQQAADLRYYNLLPEKDKSHLDRLIAARHLAKTSGNALLTSEEDKFYYEKLSELEKERVERLINVLPLEKATLTLAEQQAEDLRYYHSLPEKEKAFLDAIISAKRLTKRTGNELLLDGEDKFYYEKLSELENARIVRLMDVLPTGKTTLTLAEQQAEDLRYYHSLPEKEKALLDAIIATKRLTKRTGNELVLSGEDKFYYEKLSELEKQRIDRLMNVLPNEKNTLTLAEQKAEDLRYYHALPEKEKALLDAWIAAKRLAKHNGNELAMSTDEKFYYEKLSELEKERLDRLMHLLPEKATLTLAEQQAEDLRYYNALPEQEKALLDRIMAAKRLAKRTGNAWVLNQEDKLYYEKLSEVEKAQLDRLTAWFETTEKNRTALQDDLPVEKAQTPDIAAVISKPEPIFFNFDGYQLRKEAQKALQELASFYQKFPEVKLEVHAFADIKGEIKYNRELSMKRGQSAVDYLIKLGVPAKQLTVKAHGEANFPSLNDSLFASQANRRVEFVVKGGPAAYVWENQTYILHPAATLYSIAKAFGLSVDVLKAMNGLTSERIEAYRPLRARNVKGVIPTPMVSDPYFWISKKTDRSLTIK